MTEGFSAVNDNNKVLISSDIEHMHFGGKATFISSVVRRNETVPNYPWEQLGWTSNSFYMQDINNDDSKSDVYYQGQVNYLASYYYTFSHIMLEARKTHQLYKKLGYTGYTHEGKHYLQGTCVHTYTYTSTNPILVFIRPSNYSKRHAVIEQALVGSVWTIKVIQSGAASYPPTLFIFEPASGIPTPTSDYGLLTYLDDGTTVSFDSRLDPLIILDGGVIKPPTVPCDGGVPVDEGLNTHNNQYQSHEDCCFFGTICNTLSVPIQNGRHGLGYRAVDHDLSCETTHTDATLSTTSTGTNLMFAAPSITQAVYARVANGFSLSYSVFNNCYDDAYVENFSVAETWGMYVNAFKLSGVGQNKTRTVHYKIFDATIVSSSNYDPHSSFSSQMNNLSGVVVDDLLVTLPNTLMPSYLFIWDGSGWIWEDPADYGWSFTFDYNGNQPIPSSGDEGDMFTEYLGGNGSQNDTGQNCYRRENGAWVLKTADFTDTLSSVVEPSGVKKLEAGWCVYRANQFYSIQVSTFNSFFQYITGFFNSDINTNSNASGRRPFDAKTINLIDNAYLIADASKYE